MAAAKPKPKFKPGFFTGVTAGAAIPTIFSMLTKKKKPSIDPWKGKKRGGGEKKEPDRKPPIGILPPGRGPNRIGKGAPGSGPKVKKKLSPRFLQAGPQSGPTMKKKFTEERSKSFEDRVRALVAKKDSLKNIKVEGDNRSEYQIRMNKLKKENKKAWKDLFRMGKLKK